MRTPLCISSRQVAAPSTTVLANRSSLHATSVSPFSSNEQSLWNFGRSIRAPVNCSSTIKSHPSCRSWLRCSSRLFPSFFCCAVLTLAYPYFMQYSSVFPFIISATGRRVNWLFLQFYQLVLRHPSGPGDFFIIVNIPKSTPIFLSIIEFI